MAGETPKVPDGRNVDEVVDSERVIPPVKPTALAEVLAEMGRAYRSNPVVAVRDQSFIKLLHGYAGSQLDAHLTKFSKRRDIRIKYEPTVLGSFKPKNVDVAAIDPDSGPLVLIGVRSQMSSVGKNVLTYYEGIIGECISLQERFPMSCHGYIYLHPLASIKSGKEKESIDHVRYARMYAAVTGREGPGFKNQRGVFDQFAYMVVDFDQDPPRVCDEIVRDAVPAVDLRIETFVDRMIATFNARTLFWDVFR